MFFSLLSWLYSYDQTEGKVAPGELVLLRRISNLVLYLVDLCMDKKGDDAGHAEVDIYADKFSDERIPRLQSRWRADPARLGVNAEEILFHKCLQSRPGLGLTFDHI